MAAWNERLILEANLTQCARLPSWSTRNLTRKLMTRVHRIAAVAGIEQGSIPAILIFAVVWIVDTCFQKIAGIAVIAGVVHSDPNIRNDYMEARLKCLVRQPFAYFLL